MTENFKINIKISRLYLGKIDKNLADIKTVVDFFDFDSEKEKLSLKNLFKKVDFYNKREILNKIYSSNGRELFFSRRTFLEKQNIVEDLFVEGCYKKTVCKNIFDSKEEFAEKRIQHRKTQLEQRLKEIEKFYLNLYKQSQGLQTKFGKVVFFSKSGNLRSFNENRFNPLYSDFMVKKNEKLFIFKQTVGEFSTIENLFEKRILKNNVVEVDFPFHIYFDKIEKIIEDKIKYIQG